MIGVRAPYQREIRRNLTAFVNNAGPEKGLLVLTAIVPGNRSGTHAKDIRIPGGGPCRVARGRVLRRRSSARPKADTRTGCRYLRSSPACCRAGAILWRLRSAHRPDPFRPPRTTAPHQLPVLAGKLFGRRLRGLLPGYAIVRVLGPRLHLGRSSCG